MQTIYKQEGFGYGITQFISKDFLEDGHQEVVINAREYQKALPLIDKALKMKNEFNPDDAKFLQLKAIAEKALQ